MLARLVVWSLMLLAALCEYVRLIVFWHPEPIAWVHRRQVNSQGTSWVPSFICILSTLVARHRGSGENVHLAGYC